MTDTATQTDLIDRSGRRLTWMVAGGGAALIALSTAWVSARMPDIARGAIESQLAEHQTSLQSAGLAERALAKLQDGSATKHMGDELRLLYLDQLLGYADAPSTLLRQLDYSTETEAVVQRALPVLTLGGEDPEAGALVSNILGRFADEASETPTNIDTYAAFLSRLPADAAPHAADWIESHADLAPTATLVIGLAQGGDLAVANRLIRWAEASEPSLQRLGWVALKHLDSAKLEAAAPARREAATRLIAVIEAELAEAGELPAAVRNAPARAEHAPSLSTLDSLREALLNHDFHRVRDICAAGFDVLLCDADILDELLGDNEGQRILAALVQLVHGEDTTASVHPTQPLSPDASRRAWYAERLSPLLSLSGGDEDSDWNALAAPRINRLTDAGEDLASDETVRVLVTAWAQKVSDESTPVAERRAAAGEALASLFGAPGGERPSAILEAATATDATWIADLIAAASSAHAAQALAATAPGPKLKAWLNTDGPDDASQLTISIRGEDGETPVTGVINPATLQTLVAAMVKAGDRDDDAEPVIKQLQIISLVGTSTPDSAAVLRRFLSDAALDVWSSPVTSPTAGDVWTALGGAIEAKSEIAAHLADLLVTLDQVDEQEFSAADMAALARSDLYRLAAEANTSAPSDTLERLLDNLTRALPGIDDIAAAAESCAEFSTADDQRAQWCRITPPSDGADYVRARGGSVQLAALFDQDGRAFPAEDAPLSGERMAPLPEGDREVNYALLLMPDGAAIEDGRVDFLSVGELRGGDEITATDTGLFHVSLPYDEEVRIIFEPQRFGHYEARTFDLDESMDSVINLQTRDGDYIDSDDDGAEGLASRLLFSSGDGEDTVLVLTNIGSGEGGFMLEITETQAVELPLGEPQRVTADPDASTTFTMTLETPGRYTIETDELDVDVDTILDARWPGGENTTNDDFGDGLRSRIQHIAFEPGGALIELRNIGGIGETTLLAQYEPLNTNAIALGSSQRVDLAARDAYIAVVETGETGQLIVETSELSSEVDTVVKIRDSSGALLAENDDRGLVGEVMDYSSYLETRLPPNQTFYLELTNIGEPGGFTLAVRED